MEHPVSFRPRHQGSRRVGQTPAVGAACPGVMRFGHAFIRGPLPAATTRAPDPLARRQKCRRAPGRKRRDKASRFRVPAFDPPSLRAAWHPSSRSSRSGSFPGRAAKALAARASQRDAFLDLGIPTSATASLESPAGTIASGDPARAEDMMRERSQATIEHVQTFERRGRSVAVADPVAFSAAGPRPPAA